MNKGLTLEILFSNSALRPSHTFNSKIHDNNVNVQNHVSLKILFAPRVMPSESFFSVAPSLPCFPPVWVNFCTFLNQPYDGFSPFAGLLLFHKVDTQNSAPKSRNLSTRCLFQTTFSGFCAAKLFVGITDDNCWCGICASILNLSESLGRQTFSKNVLFNSILLNVPVGILLHSFNRHSAPTCVLTITLIVGLKKICSKRQTSLKHVGTPSPLSDLTLTVYSQGTPSILANVYRMSCFFINWVA